MKAVRLIILLLPVIMGSPLAARTLQLPLHIDVQFIDELIRSQLFTSKNHSTRIMDDGSGCQFVKLSNPKTSIVKRRLRTLSDVNVRAGSRAGSQCMLLVDWHGKVEVFSEISLSADRSAVLLNVVESHVLAEDGGTDAGADLIWQSAQTHLPAKFSSVALDLKQPLSDLKTFLSQSTPGLNKDQLDQFTQSLVVTSVQVVEEGVDIVVEFSVPADKPQTAKRPSNQTPEAKLSEQELQHLQQQLDALDAFVTFVIKTVALQLNDKAIEMDLFDVLIETRYAIRDALAEDAERGEQDPVKQLFISVWQQLRPVVRKTAAKQADAQAMQYLAFIGAADALQALEAVSPELGLDISVDGLRRLARMLLPSVEGDPVEYNESIDPVLRNLFQLGFVLVEPANANAWWQWFINAAHAADKPSDQTLQLLNNTLPSQKILTDYLQSVNQLLAFVIHRQLSKGKLADEFHSLFENTVYTVAWQESCWRQYIKQKGQRVPLRSGTGDVGVMQINARVWRGFYDLNELKWNFLYNAQAGGEIVLRYLTRYAIAREEHQQPGGVDNLARSTYSMYNGGPRRYNRYRLSKLPAHLKKIDELFYEKYQVVKQGDKLAVRGCLAGIK